MKFFPPLQNGVQVFLPGLSAIVVAFAFNLSTSPAKAADGTWIQTASGTWGTPGNWTGGTVAGGSGFTAYFNTLNISGTSTVSLGASQTIGNLIFGDTNTSSAGSWVLNNGGNVANVLNLAGTTPTITVTALGTGATATISAIITGSNGLTKDGAGILTLSGSNTFTGGVNITGGELRLAGSSSPTADANLGAAGGAVSLSNGAILRSLGDGTYTVGTGRSLTVGTGGGTLAASGFSPRTFAFNMDGGGLITLAAGSTAIRLSGSNSNTGGFLISSGGVEFQTVNSLPGTGSISIGASGGLISISGAGAYTSPQAWLSSGRIDTASTGALLLTGTTNSDNVDFTGYNSLFLGASNLVNLGPANTINYSGTITPAGSTYRIGHNAGNNALTLQLSQTNQLTGARDLIVGNGTALGVVWLSASNNYTGATTVSSSGRLIVSNNGALGSNQVSVANGGELRLRDNVTINNALVLSGGPTDTAFGALHGFSGSNSYNGNISLSAGSRIAASNTAGNSLTINGNVSLGSSGLTILAGSSSAFAGGNITVTGSLGGSGNIVKSNSTGELALTGNNTGFSGTVTNQGGMIAVGSNTALGTGTLVLSPSASGGTSGIQSTDGTTRTLANALGTFAGSNAIYAFGATSGPGTGNLVFSNVATASLGSSAARTFQVNNTTTFAGGFSGGGSSITKTGSGTMVMNGVSTYTGTTGVNVGTLLVNGQLSASSAVTVATGATLGGSGTVSGATVLNGLLNPGQSGVADELTFGSTFNISGITTGIGALQFDLGSASDQVILTSGVLTIGSGLLEWDDFSFTALSGFGEGTYTLFATTQTISGSLGTTLTGTINGMDATISLADGGTDIILTVVPEPAAVLMTGAGLFCLLIGRRRRA